MRFDYELDYRGEQNMFLHDKNKFRINCYFLILILDLLCIVFGSFDS